MSTFRALPPDSGGRGEQAQRGTATGVPVDPLAVV
jgi:hypothetical protein